jgi:uncharacterized protein
MIAVRLVLDTNVFVSAALKPEGLQRTVIVLALTKPARWYVSADKLAEYREVLFRPEFAISKGAKRRLMDLVESR